MKATEPLYAPARGILLVAGLLDLAALGLTIGQVAALAAILQPVLFGERQRLALARALLQDAPVLLLDEVTANLNPLSERLVFELIQELARERTVLLATHRINHLEWADVILVLDEGRIVERGPQHELQRSGGTYQRLRSVEDCATL
jgi:ABC-type transport system involved in Fe-S cluster assembly fused permease/ATPase subunit